MNYYTQSIEQTISSLDSNLKGLSTDEAVKRKHLHGLNALKEIKRKPPWIIFLFQFRDFMIWVLIMAAVISGIIGDITDTIIILIIILINAVIGFIQEYRAEKAMDALKKLATIQAVVLRDGLAKELSSVEIVPGDIVLLETGNAVPADLRLIETHSLKINESSLTGESLPADKNAIDLEGDQIPLGDRVNTAYKSTLITSGRGQGIVVGTGMNTEIGKIATLLQNEDPDTPLQKRMADFSKKLSYLILFICLLLFLIGMLRGEDTLKMLLISISLAVAAIPEALPALITIALARGANRLSKQNALVRKLPAVETLGSVTFICTDKTGTLTINQMTVLKSHQIKEVPEFSERLSYLDAAMALNHNVHINTLDKPSGDPTEIALVDYCKNKIGEQIYSDCIKDFPRKAEFPFDPDRKCMSTLHQHGEEYFLFSKGAMENINERLTDKDPSHAKLAEEWAGEGLRVLAFAYRKFDALPPNLAIKELEKDLIFLGMTGMIDPPRPAVKLAIGECQSAGIRTVMITGDHPITAAAIARQVGIIDGVGEVINGAELKALSDHEFENRVEHIDVYARVSPEQKLKIVKTLQYKGHYVAMTGDGVNDAPSLKAANIGVAMGINGTDVSKEAADLILLDDDFATIVKAVKEGRRIYDNIRKFVKYILTCNGAEIWTIFLAPLFGLPMPLLPIHILWINLVTDGLPGLALANEKAERDIMQLPPRKAGESIFSGGIGYHILWVGLLMAGVTLGIQAWAISHQNSHWQSMVFTVLSLTQLGHVLAIRSERDFLYRQGLLSNKALLVIVFFTFILQLAVLYLPLANRIFKTQPLTLDELLWCIGLAALVFHAIELEKWIKQIYKRRQTRSLNNPQIE